MKTERISLAQQLHLLINTLRLPQGQPYTLTAIAEKTGITPQTLFNLLHKRNDNPRINTLRLICDFYGISLIYFESQTEQECMEYLRRQQYQRTSPLVQELQREVETLSERGKRNVLTVLEWIRLASQC